MSLATTVDTKLEPVPEVVGLEAKQEPTFTATVGQILASHESLARLTQEKVTVVVAQQIMWLHKTFRPICQKFSDQRRELLETHATEEPNKWKFETPEKRAEYEKGLSALTVETHTFSLDTQLSLAELKACAVKISSGDLDRLAYLISGLE